MSAEPTSDAREVRQGELMAEARAAVAYSANSLRALRERFREGHLDGVQVWDSLRDELSAADRAPSAASGAPAGEPAAEEAAEAGAADARVRALRRDEAFAARSASADASALARLDLALTSLERLWLLLSPDDASLVTDPAGPIGDIDLQMRIVEAQEAERMRLAREIHDGPAQTLSNAVFQVEIVERLLLRSPTRALNELQLMRDMLRRELADIRAFIVQLKPPILADLGLIGAIHDAAEQVGTAAGITMDVDLDPAIDTLPDAVETVILRIIQEALQNVRRHAAAEHVTIRAMREGDDVIVEVRDDGHGFDVDAVAARGRRNFGLQFMRDRAELINARFEVRSRTDGGTVVRIAIPGGTEENA
jgi:two-component system sensor histidine kinase DegS